MIWMATQIVGQGEQPRVPLLAVPYSPKAKDADRIGGLPRSAFILAEPATSGAAPIPNLKGALQ